MRGCVWIWRAERAVENKKLGVRLDDSRLSRKKNLAHWRSPWALPSQGRSCGNNNNNNKREPMHASEGSWKGQVRPHMVN